ncbi:MAG: adenylate/guanylate cyclase domain-containing protein [Actinobacteria bacterium]|nr:MAG: adenylate/guanylate cyclase domain-containing protein [Actinomycetota bacterium]
MAEMPQTRYAKSGEVHIAYQVFGAGPPDVVYVPGLLSHLDLTWEDRLLSRFFTRLASFSRVILFDKRGTGLSDRDVGMPTLEQRMEDLHAVMEAVGSERAAIFGYSDGGAMSILFAATYPRQTSALVLCMTTPSAVGDIDFPCGDDIEAMSAELVRLADEAWGEGATLRYFGASVAHEPWARQLWGRWERLSVSPSGARALVEMDTQIDVRPVLSAVAAPTLVIHRSDDHAIPRACGRYLAEHIDGARYWEQPGEHLLGLGDADALLDEVEEFLTGVRSVPEPDRMLATVLFTDIVGSTERATALGDKRWRELLDAHHRAVRRELDRFRGQEIDTAGDGFFATFDGPGRAVRCACAIRDSVKGLGLDLRAGLHTGEIELQGEKIGGIAVHIGARVSALARAGEVLVSRTVVDLVAGSQIEFADRGEHDLKGVPGTWRLFAVH